MPTELSNDIWIEIVEEYLRDTYTPWTRLCIYNLSLTNKQLRQISISALYHSLTFDVDFRIDRPYATLTSLVRTVTRVRSLQYSSDLLRHVRELSLGSWSDYEEVIEDLPPDASELPLLADIGNPCAAIYDSVTGLVPRMSGLRNLHLSGSPMTRHLHDSLCRSSLLEYLNLGEPFIEDFWSTSHRQPRRLPIHRLTYYADEYRSSPSTSADAYLTHILNHCVTNLEALDISSCKLPLLITCISNHRPSLRNLKIVSPRRPLYESVLWHILETCPYIHALELEKYTPDPQALQRASNILPNLESITGTPLLIQALTFSKPMERITGTEPLDHSRNTLMDVLQCSIAHLLHLSLHVRIKSYKDVLACLRSLKQFHNLTHLALNFHDSSHDGLGQMMGLEVFYAAIAHALLQWPQLRICYIHGPGHPPDHYASQLECPIAPEGDPWQRGHPSLKKLELWIQDVDTWNWIYGQGWTRRWQLDS